MLSRLVVTGASGWIGKRVASAGLALGHDIVVVDRADPSNGPWSTYIVADISAEDFAERVCGAGIGRVDAFIHCAGYAHRPTETTEEIKRFDDINRLGTIRVVELARRLGVERIVYLSSIAFYDWSKGTGFAEDGPTAASTAYARSKLAGEAAVLESGLDARVARLATVFGNGDRANFAKLATSLADRRFVIPGDGNAQKSVIPVEIVAELLVDLAVLPSARTRITNLGLPVAPSLSEICDAYSDLCGFSHARHLPYPVIRAAALLGDLVAKAKPNFPVTTSNLQKLTRSTTVDVTAMMKQWPDRQWPTFAEALAGSSGYYRSVAGLE